MFGDNCVVPANSRLSPANPGASWLVQFRPVLKLLSPPPPPQTSLLITTVSGRFATDESDAVSDTVADSVLAPAAVPAATAIVLVHRLPPAFTRANVEEPPIRLVSTTTLLTVPALPFVVSTEINTR